jgi:hypothetical protein
VAQTLYQVNSGGGAANPFIADAYFSGGTASGTSSTIDTSGVTNPAPQSVYQSERWGNWYYNFPNLVAGASYRVRLHFAEIYWNAAGTRVFNVYINGIQVLANYDVFADAGGKNKATVKEFTANADGSGQIFVQYTNIAGKDNAKSSGIEILPILAAPTDLTATVIPSGQVKLSWSASTNATGYIVKWTTINGGPYTSITNVSGLAYTNTALNNGTLYYFVVSATNAFGESANSSQLSARPVSTTTPKLDIGTSNNQIQIAWPADHVGWRLEIQTHLADAGLGANWTTVSGSTTTNQLFLPIGPAEGSTFFRLAYP